MFCPWKEQMELRRLLEWRSDSGRRGKKGAISVRGQIFHFMLARQFIRNVNPACCDDV